MPPSKNSRSERKKASLRFKVFLSWSGETSRQVASVLYGWLPAVLQAVAPFMSQEEITKGELGRLTMARELEDTNFGILCLTSENTKEPWILFEAGALSKKLDEAAVCPFLFGIGREEIAPPLQGFQSTSTTEKADVRRLCATLNAKLDALGIGLEDATFDHVFEKWWPELEKQLSRIDPPPGTPRRKELPELVEEIGRDVRALVAAEVDRLRVKHGLDADLKPKSTTRRAIRK